jgi:hypothetical protein
VCEGDVDEDVPSPLPKCQRYDVASEEVFVKFTASGALPDVVLLVKLETGISVYSRSIAPVSPSPPR